MKQMTIREKIINAVNSYVKEHGYETWMSGTEFKDFVNSHYEGNINPRSLIPTDYCYTSL